MAKQTINHKLKKFQNILYYQIESILLYICFIYGPFILYPEYRNADFISLLWLDNYKSNQYLLWNDEVVVYHMSTIGNFLFRIIATKYIVQCKVDFFNFRVS